MASRREALKSLFALPGVFSIRGQVQPVDDPLRAHRKRGIQALRFLNTAELWHKHRAERYVPFPALQTSSAVAALRTYQGAIIKGIGAAFIDNLDFNNDEIIPGWRLHLELIDGGTSYQAVLEDLSQLGVGELWTDADGVIRSSSPVPAPNHQPRGFLQKVVSYAASLGFSQPCGYTPGNCDPYHNFGCWYSGGCCVCESENNCCVECVTVCCNNALPDACVNCGCGSCVWSCHVLWFGCC